MAPVIPIDSDAGSDEEGSVIKCIVEAEKPESKALSNLNWISLLKWADDSRAYREITKEQLLAELQKTTKWAKSYGDGYVGESHFVYNILARFFWQSYRLLFRY